jgi:hydroxymethylpyrimidine/phosphomethylpyrimidine kinase
VIPTALSIAGSDPSGGAGIQADLKTFLDLGVYGMAAITALTTQSTQGVLAVHPVDPDVVRSQLRAVLADMPIGAIKIGMVGSSARVITELLAEVEVPTILDPVLASSSGHPLLAPAELPSLRALACSVSLITPNTSELETLLQGEDPSSWAKLTGTAVLHTGGHGTGEQIEDALFLPDGRCLRMVHERIQSRATHGTGCTLSAAIAAGMARGWPLDRAVDAAIISTAELVALSSAHPLGRGTSPLLHGLLRARAPEVAED